MRIRFVIVGVTLVLARSAVSAQVAPPNQTAQPPQAPQAVTSRGPAVPRAAHPRPEAGPASLKPSQENSAHAEPSRDP